MINKYRHHYFLIIIIHWTFFCVNSLTVDCLLPYLQYVLHFETVVNPAFKLTKAKLQCTVNNSTKQNVQFFY